MYLTTYPVSSFFESLLTGSKYKSFCKADIFKESSIGSNQVNTVTEFESWFFTCWKTALHVTMKFQESPSIPLENVKLLDLNASDY